MSNRSNIIPVFKFDEIWKKCLTKPFEFTKPMQHTELEKLESLRKLSAMRAAALQTRPTDNTLLNHIENLESYIFHLNDLKRKSDIYWTKNTERQMIFYWLSPLAARTDFIRLMGIDLEIAMVMFLYGCALREVAHLEIKKAMQECKESSWVHEPIRILRQASGVFGHIRSEFGERIDKEIPDMSNSPAELVPVMSECMQKVCLGEAQSLLAYRGHECQKSSTVVSSLHMGASDLFEQASLLLRNNTGKFNFMSDKFRRFLALSCSLEQVRAYQQTGQTERSNNEAGMAVGLCQKALSLLETCLVVGEDDESWLEIIEEERSFSHEVRDCFDQDRMNVFYQQIPITLRTLSDGKILVDSSSYQPPEKQCYL